MDADQACRGPLPRIHELSGRSTLTGGEKGVDVVVHHDGGMPSRAELGGALQDIEDDGALLSHQWRLIMSQPPNDMTDTARDLEVMDVSPIVRDSHSSNVSTAARSSVIIPVHAGAHPRGRK